MHLINLSQPELYAINKLPHPAYSAFNKVGAILIHMIINAIIASIFLCVFSPSCG